MEFSREFGLRANVVEKDYVLGWMLAGIFNHPVIESSWVFKGGTCLKKCFFETYRFSEDLDFTLSESNHLDQEFLVSCFKEIAQWVYNETGIEIPQDLIRTKIKTDIHVLVEMDILLIQSIKRINEPRCYLMANIDMSAL